MAGLAATMTDRATRLPVAVLDRTIGLIARAVARLDGINVGLTQRNAFQAVAADRSRRREWES